MHGDIGRQGPAVFSQLRADRVQLRLVQVGNEDLRTLLQQACGNALADRPGGTGHEGHFVLKLHRFSPRGSEFQILRTVLARGRINVAGMRTRWYCERSVAEEEIVRVPCPNAARPRWCAELATSVTMAPSGPPYCQWRDFSLARGTNMPGVAATT